MIQSEHLKLARKAAKTVMAVVGRPVSLRQEDRIAARVMEEILPMIPKKLLRPAGKVVSTVMEGITNRKAA